MEIREIIQKLEGEHSRIGNLLDSARTFQTLLNGEPVDGKRRGRPPGSKNGATTIIHNGSSEPIVISREPSKPAHRMASEANRAKQSKRMKAYWKKRKAAKK